MLSLLYVWMKHFTTLPHVKRIEYLDLDHSAPNQSRPNQKGPERIAGDLRAFFSQS